MKFLLFILGGAFWFFPSDAALRPQDELLSVCSPQRNPITVRLAEFIANPKDSDAFTELYLSAQNLVGMQVASRMHWDAETSEEKVQALFSRLWAGEVAWPGDRSWPDAQTIAWLAGAARGNDKSTSVSAFHLAPSPGEEWQGDPLAEFADSGSPMDGQLTQAKIDRLPDALHRFVLMRVMQGKKMRDIGAELDRSASYAGDVLREARGVLSEVLKGRSVPLTSAHRRADVMLRVQQILEDELAPRPVRMPENAVLVEFTDFEAALNAVPPHIAKVARLYYLEGKTREAIGQQVPLSQRQITRAIEKAARPFTPHYSKLWILNQGVPAVAFRQGDFAPEPKAPVDITLEEFAAALHGWSLRNQQMAKMRYVEGLSNVYIARAMGVRPGVADSAVREAAEKVAKQTGKPVSTTTLRISGDRAGFFTSEVRLPLKPFLAELEVRQAFGEDAKLALAREFSGLPVQDLARLVLVNGDDRVAVESIHQNVFEPPVDSGAIKISAGSFQVVKSRLSELDARALELYVRHRFSYVLLEHYLDLPRAELIKRLERARKQVGRELGDVDVALSLVVVAERGRPTTVQVASSEFRAKWLELDDKSVASTMRMVAQWKGWAISAANPFELVDEAQRPLFTAKHDFFALAPTAPVQKLKRSDFLSALRQTHLSELDQTLVRMRLEQGWGTSGLEFLLDLPAKTVRDGLNRARYALGSRLSETVYLERVLLVDDGTATLALTHFEIDYDELARRAREANAFDRASVTAVAAAMLGKSPGEVDLTKVTPMRDGRPALAKGQSLVEAEPTSPLWVTRAQLESAVARVDQREVCRLRFTEFWTRSFIGLLLQLNDVEVDRLYSSALDHLKKKVDANISAATLRLR